MKTGLFRVRKSFFGKSILQEQIDSPSWTGGGVDSLLRNIYWRDVKFEKAPILLKDIYQKQTW